MRTETTLTIWTRKKARERVANTFAYLALIVMGAIILVPFLWMVSTSLKPRNMVYVFPPRWLPQPVMLQNYPQAWKMLPVGRFFLNSFVFVALCVIGETLVSSIVAFGFARLRFRGSVALFFILLGTMMLPSQVTMIPQYLLFSRLGWTGSYKPLIIPVYFGQAFLIFLLRQFFTTIPRELDDSAKMDGCGYLGIYRRITLPMSKPALGVVAVFSFQGTWHYFVGPLIYLNRMEQFPIALGLMAFQTSLGRVDWTSLMAVSTLSMLPPIAVFFVAQRYYIQGITLTGVKG